MNKKQKPSLKQAVRSIFGENLQDQGNASSEWKIFAPFSASNGKPGSTILLKLMEMPANFLTSEQMVENTKIKFKNLIHEVEFYLIQRNIEYNQYLLKAQKNLISVQAYIQIKRKSFEKVEERVILNFLEFAKQLQEHPLAHKISFTADQVGIDESGKFMLANYSTYFTPIDSLLKNQTSNLSYDVKSVLFKLINLDNGKFNLSEFYSYVEQNYSKNMFELVQNCIKRHQFKASEVLTTYNTEEQDESVLETTLTESFNTNGLARTNDQNIISSNSTCLDEPLIAKAQGKKKSKIKGGVIGTIFVLMLLFLGGVALKYLRPRPLQCTYSEYVDKQQNLCKSCDPSCNECEGGTLQQCLSCRQKFYLVKKMRNDKVGKCSLDCSGTKLNSYTCIVDNK